MADFDPPFDDSGERRVPTPDEQANGFPCGPADRALFGGLFHRIESELGAVIDAAGIAQSNSDYTQVLQAIQALIAAATGDGDTEDFILMAQARARLPIFPEIMTGDNRIIINSPGAGTVRVPSGVIIQHRGIFQFTTVQTDFATAINKVYHLRWNPTDGFTLKDLSNGTYNPGTLPDANVAFDTKFDDMLVARITTNGANVATITNLANAARLTAKFAKNTEELGPNSWTGLPRLTGNINWGRTPNPTIEFFDCEPTNYREAATQVGASCTRYTLDAFAGGYITTDSVTGNVYISGQIHVRVDAL